MGGQWIHGVSDRNGQVYGVLSVALVCVCGPQADNRLRILFFFV